MGKVRNSWNQLFLEMNNIFMQCIYICFVCFLW